MSEWLQVGLSGFIVVGIGQIARLGLSWYRQGRAKPDHITEKPDKDAHLDRPTKYNAKSNKGQATAGDGNRTNEGSVVLGIVGVLALALVVVVVVLVAGGDPDESATTTNLDESTTEPIGPTSSETSTTTTTAPQVTGTDSSTTEDSGDLTMIRGLAWSPDGARLAATTRESITFFDKTADWAGSSFPIQQEGEYYIDWSLDGRMIAILEPGAVKIYEPVGFEQVGSVECDWDCQFGWHPTSNKLIVVEGHETERKLSVWEVGDFQATIEREQRHDFSETNTGGWPNLFTPVQTSLTGSDRFATACGRRSVCVFDWETLDLVSHSENIHRELIEFVRWDPSGTMVISGGHSGDIVYTDADTGQEVQRLEDIGNSTHFEYSFDETWLVSTGGSGRIRVWPSTDPGSAPVDIRTAEEPKAIIYSIEWSPSENLLASGDFVGMVDIWEFSPDRPPNKIRTLSVNTEG